MDIADGETRGVSFDSFQVLVYISQCHSDGTPLPVEKCFRRGVGEDEMSSEPEGQTASVGVPPALDFNDLLEKSPRINYKVSRHVRTAGHGHRCTPKDS